MHQHDDAMSESGPKLSFLSVKAEAEELRLLEVLRPELVLVFWFGFVLSLFALEGEWGKIDTEADGSLFEMARMHSFQSNPREGVEVFNLVSLTGKWSVELQNDILKESVVTADCQNPDS